MSRAYNMCVTVTGYAPEQEHDIQCAAEEVWDGFEDSWSTHKASIFGSGDGHLSMDSDSEFAEQLTHAVWKANGAFCTVDVICTLMENLPFERFVIEEAGYKTWKERKHAESV